MDKIDAALIVPESAEPMPLSELLELAEVTEQDITAAVTDWKAKNSGDEFEKILEADPE